MPSKLSTVNFGSAFTGLATVGYTTYNQDGTTQKARTTSGVSEIGTSTGNYKATLNYPQNFTGYILWDTGGGSPRYASESINPIDADPVADAVKIMIRSLNKDLSIILQDYFMKYKDDGKSKKSITNIEKLMLELKPFISKEINSIEIGDDEVDFSSVIKEIKSIKIPEYKETDLSKIERKIDAIKIPEPPDLSPIKALMDSIKSMYEKQRTDESNRFDQLVKLNQRLESVRQSFSSNQIASKEDIKKALADMTQVIKNLEEKEDDLLSKALEKLFSRMASNFQSSPEVQHQHNMKKQNFDLALGIGV